MLKAKYSEPPRTGDVQGQISATILPEFERVWLCGVMREFCPSTVGLDRNSTP